MYHLEVQLDKNKTDSVTPDLLELPYSFAIESFIDYFEKNKSRGFNNQLSLKHRPGMSPYEDGCGMAYSLENQQQTFSESDFSILNADLSSEMIATLQKIEGVAMQEFGHKLGRIRLLNLKFKTCLSYHVDYDSFRLHVPLITNSKCFFVVNDKLHRMPKPGSLYFLNTGQLHTAVNASFCYDRLHLVCGTYAEQ